MRERVYISNIAKAHPVEAQEEALARTLPDWPDVTIYRDILPGPKRRGQSREAMKERASMLRATAARRDGEVINVTSPPVLAWDAGDLADCLSAASARGATVVFLDSGLRIPPNAGADILGQATKDFLVKKRSAEAGGGRKIGAAASAKARLADAERRIGLIQADWPLEDTPTDELLERAGRLRKIGKKTVLIPMAYATATKYLGHRPEAQRKRRVALAVAEQNRQRKAARDGKA